MSRNDGHLITITNPQQDRYASLRLIDWWDQDRIKASRVMVVGAGALGNEVLKNLALLGVGHLFIVDFDTIEASNLTRSVLFRSTDGGLPKSNVAAERVQVLNPDVKAKAFYGDVMRDLGLGVYRRMDVIISCLDNRAARMAVNWACWNVEKPWVDGALDVWDGQVRVFVPPNGPCYECTMTKQDYALVNLRYSCPPGFAVTVGRQPTLPTTTSIIAAMQVQETMKLLHGLPVQTGQSVSYSGETMRLSRMTYPRRENCPAHQVYDDIINLPYGVNDLTLNQFVKIIRSYTQKDEMLFLPEEIVTFFWCQTCNHREAIYRPYRTMTPEQILCPRCGKHRELSIAATLAAREFEQTVPLSQLGFPSLHVLPVRSENGWTYFELSGDEQHLLNTW